MTEFDAEIFKAQNIVANMLAAGKDKEALAVTFHNLMLPITVWEKKSKVSIQKILEHLDRINTNIIAIERNQRTQLELMFTQ